jgi:hypothetical protein
LYIGTTTLNVGRSAFAARIVRERFDGRARRPRRGGTVQRAENGQACDATSKRDGDRRNSVGSGCVQPVYGSDRRYGVAIERFTRLGISTRDAVPGVSTYTTASRLDSIRDAIGCSGCDRVSNGDADAAGNERSGCDRFTQARRGAQGPARCGTANSIRFD